MRVTRRKIVALAAALPAAAQQPAPPAAAPPDENEAARAQFRSAGEQLAKFKVPMAVEPAAIFKV